MIHQRCPRDQRTIELIPKTAKLLRKGSADQSGANPENSSAAAKKLKALQKRRKTNTRSEAALICEADYTIGVDDCAATQLLKAKAAKATQLLKAKAAQLLKTKAKTKTTKPSKLLENQTLTTYLKKELRPR